MAVTTVSQAAAGKFDALTRAFLAHGKATQNALCECFEADDRFTMAHAARGFFCVLLGQRRYLAPAEEALAKARACAAERGATARETRLIEALADLVADRPAAAVDKLNRQLEREPLDAFTIKVSHGLQFMLGRNAGMRASLESVMPAWREDTPDAGYILGCYGFALEETGDYRAGEITARRGVAIAPDDAWGWHAVAHVMEMQGRAREGISWLGAFEDRLPQVNNFGYHVYWHKALFHLELGEIDRVLRLYDEGIRNVRTDDFRDIANGASLLMRLHFDGVDVGDRWEELADLATGHACDHILTFADAHYAMALAGAGRPDALADMRAAIEAAGQGEGHGAQMMRRFGVPLVAGISAFGAGDYAAAEAALASVRSSLQAIGGSHAQRDVLEQMVIEAAMRAGHGGAAVGLLRERLGRRPANLWAQRRLERLGASSTPAARGSAPAIA